MKRRLGLFIVVLIMTVIITYGEYQYLKGQVTETELSMVCFAAQSLEPGSLISSDDIELKAMNIADVEAQYITSKSDLLGRYTRCAIEKGSVFIPSQYDTIENLSLALSEDHILVTFEFSHETSNAWNLRKGQVVQLLFCPKEGGQKLYDGAVIYAIYDKNGLYKNGETQAPMQYVTFEVERDMGYELIANRELGRIEIIVL
jgi:hypothetical protein